MGSRLSSPSSLDVPYNPMSDGDLFVSNVPRKRGYSQTRLERRGEERRGRGSSISFDSFIHVLSLSTETVTKSETFTKVKFMHYNSIFDRKKDFGSRYRYSSNSIFVIFSFKSYLFQ